MNESVRFFSEVLNVDYFFIRMDAETREIGGKEMVDYCEKHFD